MPESARDVLDRLSLNPRPGRGRQRVQTGMKAVDARLEGGFERGGLHEVRAPLARDIGAATGALMGLLVRLGQVATAATAAAGPRRVLWVSDPGVTPDAGLLYPDGIAQYGLDPGLFTLVQAVDLKTALWAADEGARCTDLLAVVLHIRGNPARLDRVATRRLMLRAQGSGVTVFVLRQSGAEEAGAAHTRWCVSPRPSPRDASFPAGIGLPAFALTLERSRNGQTGRWPVSWNPKTHAYAHEPQIPVDLLPASAHRPDRTGAVGQVVALGRAP